MSNQEDFKQFQQLWQESTTNESLSLQQKTMMERIKTDVDTFNKDFGFRGWKDVLPDLGLFIVSVAVIVKSIMKHDFSSLAIRIASALLWGTNAFFKLWLMWKARGIEQLNYREYLEMNIQRITWYLNYGERVAPYVLLGAAVFFAFGVVESEYWFWILIGFVIGVGLALMNGKREVFDPVRNLRSKLTTALRQLDE